MLAVAGVFLLPGCSALRNRLVSRSAQCSQLCEESRQARERGEELHAERLLDAAIRRRPTDAQTQLDLADELWSSGRQLAAADLVARVVADQPQDAVAALRLARMEFEIGRVAAAETALRSSMTIDPENPEALRLTAELAEHRGDWETALATYHQLVQVLPDDLDAQLAMAAVHIRRGQSSRAAPMLRSVLQHPQATVEQRRDAEWQLGTSYAQSERWHDAARCLQAAAQHGNTTAEDWYRVAYAQARVGNQEAAYASISESLRINPGHAGALELARRIKLGEGDALSGVVPAGFARQTASAADDPASLRRL